MHLHRNRPLPLPRASVEPLASGSACFAKLRDDHAVHPRRPPWVVSRKMARHDVLTPVLLSCVSGSATAVGGLIVLCIKGRPSQRLISFVLSFAAGVMVIVSIFDLWWPLARESASAFVTSTACLAAGAGACRLLQYVPIPEPEDLFVHLLGEDPPPGTRRQQELGGMGTAVAGARLEAADDPEAGLAGMSVPGAASAAASSASSSSSSVGAVRHLSPRPSPHAMSLAGDALFDQGAAAHALPPSAGMMMPADASSGSGASLLRRDDDAAAGAVAAGSSGAVSAASSGGGVGIDGGGASARSSYTAGKQSPPVAYDGGGGGVVKARRHMAASWRLGMMLAIVLTIHNLPEGVAVGLGAVKSQSLGLVLCAAM